MPTTIYEGCADCCGGGTVDRPCCENEISTTLTAAFTATGCDCLDGVEVEIEWDEGLGYWTGTTTACGAEIEVQLICEDTDVDCNGFEIDILVDSVVAVASNVDSGCACDPFSVSYAFDETATGEITCGSPTFDITLTITE